MHLKFIKLITLCSISLIVFGMVIQDAQAMTRAQPKTLSQRVNKADAVFLGKLKNKEVTGDWVTAELHVEVPLRGAKEKQIFNVTWRAKLGTFKLFDVKEGTQGIAILKQKRKDRYWLRSDMFEKVEKLADVQRIITK